MSSELFAGIINHLKIDSISGDFYLSIIETVNSFQNFIVGIV